jgi:hypothetical protein
MCQLRALAYVALREFSGFRRGASDALGLRWRLLCGSGVR